MKITSTKDETTLTFLFEGKLNSLTEQQFRKEIENMPKETTSVVLDFAKLTYISSIGLVLIYTLRKKLGTGGSVKIIHAEGMVKSVLELSGTEVLLNGMK